MARAAGNAQGMAGEELLQLWEGKWRRLTLLKHQWICCHPLFI